MMKLVRDQKKTVGVYQSFSNAAVLREPMHWMLVFVFVSLLVGGNIFDKPMLAIILIVYLPLAFVNLHQLAGLFFKSFSMQMFWLLFVTSYFWSIVQKVTIDIIMTQSAFIILAIFISLSYKKEGFAKPLRTASMLVLGLVTLYCLVFPGASFSAVGLTAFYPHKNSLGVVVALCVLVLFYVPGRTKIHVGLGLLAAGLTLASQSKTSINLLVICSVILPLAGLWAKNFYSDSHRLMMTDIVRSALYSLVLLSLILMVMFRDELLGLLWAYLPKSALTGRGTLWLVVIQQIRDTHSLLGIGPGVFWHADGASEIAQTTLFQWDPNWVQHMVSADGSYIDLVASIGVLGLALFLLTVVDLYRRLFRHWNQPDSQLIFVLVTFILLHAITESTILYSTNILWLMYLLCYFRVAGYAATNPTPTLWQRLWG